MRYFPNRPSKMGNLDSCTTCSNKIKGFKDELSLKEFYISGMCQECQDKVFEVVEIKEEEKEDDGNRNTS